MNGGRRPRWGATGPVAGWGAAGALLIVAAAAVPGFAAAMRNGTVTIGMATLSPLVALIAGVLILIVPRLLNLVVALYLIIIGLIGLFGR
jgi:hypothetical protein